MRIPVGRVYRAFPELDRFTDAQGEQFVRAACKRGWRRHFHRALIILFLLLGWVAASLVFLFGAALLDRVAPTLDRSNTAFWTLTTLSLLLFATPIFLTLLVKDWFLLRRLRLVIRARGTCPACAYTLLGAMVAGDNIVTCPECGMTIEADVSLDEVATDDAGRKVFMPSGKHKSLEFWTPRRRRVAKRLAIAAAVFVFVVLPLSWGGYEIFLRKQAATAAAERPGAEGILAFVEAAQPAGSSNEENGWTAMESIAAVVDDVEAEVIAETPANPSGRFAHAVYDYVYRGLGDISGFERSSEAKINQQVALTTLDRLRDAGVLAELDSLARHRRAVYPLNLPANQPAVFVVRPSLSDTRQLARINAARMHLAFEADDREEFLSSFESGLAIARFCAQQLTLIEALVADAITALMHQQVQAALLRQPDADWLDGIEAAIERQTPRLDPARRFRGESLMGLDAICWFFAEPSRARMGRFSSDLSGFFGRSPLPGRLGTYAANRDAYTAYFEPYIEAAGTDAYARPAFAEPDLEGLVFIENLAPSLALTVQTLDRHAATDRATTTMIALERFRLHHNFYPVTLDELVPTYLDTLPLDPWSGEPFRYYNLTRPGTRHHYGLYAIGPDMQDNGGVRRFTPSGNESDTVFSPAAD